MKTAFTVAFATILVAFASTSEAVECPPQSGPLVTIIPNPEDCKTFYICNGGIPFLMRCGAGLEFNPIESVCDYPEHANCHAHHRPSTIPPATSEIPNWVTTPTTTTEPSWEPTTSSGWEPTTEPEWEPTTEPEWETTTEPEWEPTTEPEWEPTTAPEWEPTTSRR